MATLSELQVHLGTLGTILWNYGASFPVPVLEQYRDTAGVGFEFTAQLPRAGAPQPAIIKLSEIWAPVGDGRGAFTRREYVYDFVETIDSTSIAGAPSTATIRSISRGASASSSTSIAKRS